MQIKEASEKFALTERQIRDIIKADLLPEAKKNGRSYQIEDDLDIILTKNQIKGILMQIIKVKNCSGYAISRRLFPTDEALHIVMKRLYRLGFINVHENNQTIEELFEAVQITEEGFELVFGKKGIGLLNNLTPITIKNLVTVKVGCVM